MNRTCATLLALITVCILNAQENVRVVTNVVKGTPPAWKTWKASDCGMNYPGTWSMAPGTGDTIANFQSPGEASHATLAVTAKPLAGQTPEQFHQEHGPAQFANSTTTKVIDDSGPDATGSYSFSYVTAVNGAPLWQRQDVVIADGKAYQLIYTADEQNYSENLYMAEAMINSFSPGGGE
ncbi:MAG: hypothetical protein LKM36_09605 [Flavobacteriales bacterium]|jgi:hypothetical protein|nr:hypothetical protein [Flavobacteriales bacterium]MBP9160849.1 hypothetical protein [Flavobacteriales bacterium]MCI1753101.1 hypothetical protein [Flavobacteriales bacterium]